MKKYAVKTRFVFDGEFYVAAENKAEAKERIENDCGLVMGGGVHTTLPDDDVDWEFPVHPDKAVIGIRRVKCSKKNS